MAIDKPGLEASALLELFQLAGTLKYASQRLREVFTRPDVTGRLATEVDEVLHLVERAIDKLDRLHKGAP